jgi:hypothetical protein
MKYRVYDASTDKTIRTVEITKPNVTRIDILRSVQAVTIDFWTIEIDGTSYAISDIKASPLPTETK